MRVEILTIFPSLFDSFLGESLLRKAIDKGLIDIQVHDIRAFTENKHGNVDDIPYGGGSGMVMTAQPIVSALESLKKEGTARTVLLTPRGKPFRRLDAARLAQEDRLILVCGRYEGVDERITREVDEEISIGDFILNGGEVAAMAVVESVFRLLPGAVGSPESLASESFEENLLGYPQYTRPEEFRGERVPEVLLSGHHEKIKRFRMERRMEKTVQMRPDLLERLADEKRSKVNFSLALVHYPVLGKDRRVITSSITTIDVHDLARVARTYGAKSAFIVTPVEEQRKLAERLKEHWMQGDILKGEFERRVEALGILQATTSVGEMISIVKRRAKKIKMLATGAEQADNAVSADEWLLSADEADEWIILFGTAYGLAPELMEQADCRLSPVVGAGEFNHLPVRGAFAIITDRLFGLRRSKKDE